MKKILFFLSAIAFLFLANQPAAAQKNDSPKSNADKAVDAGKADKKFGEYDEIIIKRKEPGKDAKVVIEIKGNEILVDGKPLEDYQQDALAVLQRNAKRFNLEPYAPSIGGNYGEDNQPFRFFFRETNKALLGVSTEKTDQGVKIVSVMEEASAEKAGLKNGDIITKINDIAISSPIQLSETIGKMKPDDKITIRYLRDGKENTTTAILDARKDRLAGPGAIMPRGFNFDRDGLNRMFSLDNKPRLGIRAQDTEEGKGVKVLGIDKDSPAEKSGIKKDDIITSYDGSNIATVDDLIKASKETKDKSSVKVQLNRNGKAQTIELKTPKKLKTANL
ncbi:MAG TPA: PDZ domain-containing protein [Flavitalea sp.]|nr:PDZ domain-containing protein [Flavitalea sp.]